MQKNITFLIGLAWLIYGALFFSYPDWDIPLSLLMAFSTYFTADHFVQAIREKDPTRVLLHSPGAWWSIDGVYWAYWSMVDSSVMIREAQWMMSTCLYLLCGIVWTAELPGMRPKGPHLHQSDPAQSDPVKEQNEPGP
jgi:hypothetical protein